MKTEASKTSQILFAEKQKQITEALQQKPYEAMTIATRFLETYPKDEKVIALCLRTALYAKSRTNTDVLSEDVYEKGRILAEDIFMSPEYSLLHLVSKGLMNKALEDEDRITMNRALKMGAEVTSKILTEAKVALGEDHALFGLIQS